MKIRTKERYKELSEHAGKAGPFALIVEETQIVKEMR